MLLTRLIVLVWMSLVTPMILGASAVSFQDYPHKPIRMLAPPPGGVGDFVARVIAQETSIPLGQPVIIDNRPGVVAIETASKALPDGYTLLFYGSGMWTLPFLQKVPFDPVRDFSPITWLIQQPNILVVHSSVPANSVKELISLAKAKPGGLNYGSPAVGSAPFVAGELFKAMAGVNIVNIPYKSGGPAVIALLGGEVQLEFAGSAGVSEHIKSGKLRAIGVTSAQPSALFPGLPTVAATLPGYEQVTMTAMFAPARTPAAIISRLNREVVKVLNQADVKEKLFNVGAETVGSSPERLAATIKADMARTGKVIKDAGIKAD